MSSIKKRQPYETNTLKSRDRSKSQKKIKYIAGNIKNKENQPTLINKARQQQTNTLAQTKIDEQLTHRATAEVQTEIRQSLKERISSVIETESVFDTAKRSSQTMSQSSVSHLEEKLPEIMSIRPRKSSMYQPSNTNVSQTSSTTNTFVVLGLLITFGVCFCAVQFLKPNSDQELLQSDSRQAMQVSQMILDQLKLQHKRSKEQVRDEFLKFITNSDMWRQIVLEVEKSPFLSTITEENIEYWIFNDQQ